MVERLLLAAMVVFFFMIVTTAALGDVDIDDTNTPAGKEVDPGDSVTYQIGIKATKDGSSPYETDVTLTLSTPSSGWTTEFVGSNSWHIDASGWKYTNVRVTAPGDVEYQESEETYVSISNTNGTEPANIYIETTVGRGGWHLLSMVGNPRLNGSVETTVNIPFKLENHWNYNQTFDIGITHSPGDISVIGPSSLYVLSGATEYFNLTVDIGMATAKVYYITVSATDDEGETTSSVPFNFTVLPYYSYQFECEDTSLSTFPGQEAQYNFTLTNRGNSEVRYDLSYSGTLDDWTIGMNPAYAILDTNETATFRVEITPDENAPAEGPDRTKTITITATPDEGSAQAPAIDINVTTTVLQVYEAHLEGESPGEYTLPEDSVDVEIYLHNDGNAEDRFYLSSSEPSGWLIQFIPQTTMDVDRFDNESVIARITIGEDAPYGGHNVKIYAQSQGDTSIMVNLTLTVYVEEKFDCKLTNLGSSSDEVMTRYQDRSAMFNFSVENAGNRNTEFDLEVIDVSSTGWICALDNNQPDLDGGEVENVQLTITAEHKFEAGTYQFRVRALMEDLNYSNELTYQVQVEKYSVFRIVAISIDEINSSRYPYSAEGNGTGVVNADVWIENIGNDNDTAELEMWLPAGWLDLGIDPDHQIDIGYEEQASARISFRVGSDALNQEYSVWLYANSTLPDGTDVSKSLQVSVQQAYAVEVQVSGINTKETYPAEAVTFDIIIKNEGNGEDTISIDVDNKQADWDYIFTPSASPVITANDQTTVTLTVTPAGDAPKGEYEVKLNATTHGEYDKNQQVVVSVRQLYDFELTSPNPQKNGDPNWVVNYTLQVVNKGTGSDEVELEASMWPRDSDAIITIEDTWIDLAVYEINTTTITVELPDANKLDPSTYIIYVNGTSENGTVSPSDDIVVTEVFTLVVNPVYSLLLSSQTDALEGEPGDTLYYALNVKNTGTGSSGFNIERTGTYKTWASHGTEKGTTAPIIDAGETVEAYLNVTLKDWDNTPPEVRDAGYVLISLRVTCQEDTGVVETHEFNTTIKVQYGLEVGGLRTSTGLPGSYSYFNMTLQNTGTHTDTFNISVDGDTVPTGWFFMFTDANESMVTIDPNEQATVQIYLDIPLDMEEAQNQDYDISVIIDSVNDETTSPIATRNLTVEVDQYHDVEIKVTSDLKKVDKGDTVTFTPRLINKGNGDDTFQIEVEGEWATWVQDVDPPSVELFGYNDDETIDIEIEVPQDEDPDDYVFIMNVTFSSGGQTLFERQFLTVRIEHDWDVELSSFDTYKSADPGDEVAFEIKVKNSGSIMDDYDIDLSDTMAGWGFTAVWNETQAVKIQEILDLADNTHVLIQVVIDVADDNDVDPGEHDINITVTSKEKPTVFDYIVCTIDLEPFYDFEVHSADEYMTVDAGDSYNATLRINNDGNDEDDYRITTQQTPAAEWKVSHNSQANASKDGDPGEEAYVNVFIEVPKNAEALKVGFHEIIIEVKSIGETELIKNFTFKVDVDERYDFSLEINTTTRWAGFNESVQFEVLIINDGNIGDEIQMSVTGPYGDWANLYYLQNVDNTTVHHEGREIDVELESSTSEHLVFVNVSVPKRDRGSEWDELVKTEFMIKGVSEGDDDVELEENVTLRLKELFEFELIGIDDFVSVDAADGEDEAEFTFRIHNLGTREDDYLVEKVFVPSKFNVGSLGSVNNVDADENTDYNFDVAIPSSDSDIEEGEHTIILLVTSSSNTSVRHTINFTLEILEYSLEFDIINGDMNMTIDPDAGEFGTRFDFEIVNTGTRTDDYRIEASGYSTNKFKSIPTQSINDIEEDHSRTVFINVSYALDKDANDIKAGNYTFTIKVKSDADPSIVKQRTLTLTIEPFYDVELYASNATKTVSADVNNTFEIELTNIGNADDIIDLDIPEITPNNMDWVTFYSDSALAFEIDGTISLDFKETRSIYVNLVYTREEALEENQFDPEVSSRNKIFFKVRGSASSGFGDEVSVTGTLERIVSYEYDLPVEDRIFHDPVKGDTLKCHLKITNVGIHPEDFVISINNGPNDLDAAFNDGSKTLSIYDLGDEILLIINVTYDTDDLTDLPVSDAPYLINVSIDPVHGLSGPDAPDDAKKVYFDYEIDIASKGAPKIEIIGPATQKLEVGEESEYSIKITNMGNDNDDLTLSIDTASDDMYGTINGTDEVTIFGLEPGEWYSLSYKVFVNTSDAPEIDDEMINETITVTSSIGSGPTTSVSITSWFEDNYDLEEIGVTTNGTLDQYDDEVRIDLEFQITNTGTDTDSYSINATKVPSGFTLGPLPNVTSLAPYYSFNYTFYIEADDLDDLDVGNYTLKLKIISAKDPSVSRRIDFTLTIINTTPVVETDIAVPTITITYPPNGTTVTGVVVINGTAYDALSNITKVEVRIGNGSWFSVNLSEYSIQPNTTFNWSYSLNMTGFAPARYRLRFRSYDGYQYSNVTSINLVIQEQGDGKNDGGKKDDDSDGIPGFGPPTIFAGIAAGALVLCFRRRRD